MKDYQPLNCKILTNNGLNLQAIFNIEELPNGLVQNNNNQYTQIFLIAHGGLSMWKALKEADITSRNPVDDFSIQVVKHFISTELPNNKFKIIYPSNISIGLRQLGELAGWHHDSPFRVGINSEWGSWFAYRAVILTDTNFQPTKKLVSESPCDNCSEKPCISACPANAMQSGELSLDNCISYRKKTSSFCKQTCFSRVACPIASCHRYTEEQINFHYSVSMKTIEKLY